MDVLYEDNHIIIVNKKSGEIVQGDKTGDTPLSDIVRDYIKLKYHKPGNVFLGVVHRLDRPVSGVVLHLQIKIGIALSIGLCATNSRTRATAMTVNVLMLRRLSSTIVYSLRVTTTTFLRFAFSLVVIIRYVVSCRRLFVLSVAI